MGTGSKKDKNINKISKEKMGNPSQENIDRREAIKRIASASAAMFIGTMAFGAIPCNAAYGGYSDPAHKHKNVSEIYGSYSSFSYYSFTSYNSYATYEAYNSSDYTPYGSYHVSYSSYWYTDGG